jgi:mono/diheme cytochrome c family protein
MDGTCVGCHGATNPSAGLDLSTDFCGTVLDGRLVVEGDSAGSVLYQRISDAGAPMPPGGLMDQSNIDIIANWIDDGADCSGDGGGSSATGEDLYGSNCAGCHGDAGQGGSAPALGDVVPGMDAEDVSEVILLGEDEMPPINVTAGEAALIADHVIATWGG